MKKTLIATAVSAALMAPVAAQADVTVYGRIHQGIKLSNPEVGDSMTDFISVGSRFGIKASSDLGNGMTASAHYEFTTSADKPGSGEAGTVDYEGGGVPNTRIATVGVSGGFGSVSLGNQWSAWYNKLGVHVDPTFYTGASHFIGHFRTANTIKYSNSFGPVSFEVDARLDDANDGGGDGNALGVSIAANDNITLAAGIDNTKDGNSLTGVAIQVSLGNYWASVANQSQDPDDDSAPEPSTTQFWVGGSFGNTSAMLGTGQRDNDIGDVAGGEPSDVTLGVYHNLGGGLKLLYEGIKKDTDGTGGDQTDHVFGIRLDF